MPAVMFNRAAQRTAGELMAKLAQHSDIEMHNQEA